MPHGTLTFNIDTSRENRHIRGVERIPEVTYTLNNQQIGKTGFYAKSTDTYSDLTYQNYPKTFNEKTLRFDSNNDISHPFKVGFIHLIRMWEGKIPTTAVRLIPTRKISSAACFGAVWI